MIRLAFIACSAFACAGCGPTDQDIARGVLIASPGAMGLGLVMLLALFRLRARRDPTLVWDRKPVVVGMLLAAVAGVALLVAEADDRVGLLKLALVGLWLYGVSYLVLLAMAWRLWASANVRAAFRWSWLVPTILQLVPAIAVAATDVPADLLGLFWFYPGYLGLVTVPVLTLLFISETRASRGDRRT